MKKSLKNNKWLFYVFLLSIFIFDIISDGLETFFPESLLHYKISTIFFLVSRLFIIILAFLAMKEKGKYKIVDIIVYIICISLIIYGLWTMTARLLRWNCPF